MHKVNVLNVSNALRSKLILEYCETYWCKLRGLAWRRKIANGGGMVLVSKREDRANSAIHMFGMFFNLGIIWLNSDMKVVDLKLALKWRSMIRPKVPAQFVIECAPSHLNDFQIGDQIVFEEG